MFFLVSEKQVLMVVLRYQNLDIKDRYKLKVDNRKGIIISVDKF